MVLAINIIITIYLLLIISFIYGFLILKDVAPQKENVTAFSVVIPFRNEANHLPDLLLSIKALQYKSKLFEILFIDDESTDASVKIIDLFMEENRSLNVRVLNNVRKSNSPKKDAITTAINQTKHNWIITTDADCIVPKKWLQCLNNYILHYQPNMVVSPVSLVGNNKFLELFQVVDFLSMQGATIGGFGIGKPFMANGANLAYKKDEFLALNGFNNNNNIASGDDVFLLEDFIKKDAKQVLFLKNSDALVQTYVLNSWKSLINQRKRWAAKAPQFNNPFTKIIGLFVFLANFCTVLSIVLLPFYGVLGYILLLKFTVDSILIFRTAKLYKQHICMRQYLKTLIFYPFFTLYIAVMSLSSDFSWKGRRFNA